MWQPYGIPGKKSRQWTATSTGLVLFYQGTKARLLYFADWNANVIFFVMSWFQFECTISIMIKPQQT